MFSVSGMKHLMFEIDIGNQQVPQFFEKTRMS